MVVFLGVIVVVNVMWVDEVNCVKMLLVIVKDVGMSEVDIVVILLIFVFLIVEE